jgi:D-beta-D-heptose 7-phosphate kinase/D-beta-D-heptose 1-phosphate adenosyltransferase
MTPERAAEILGEARGSGRVLVVGDVMLDRYVTGSVERISPEGPVPVVRVADERSVVGGAANVAANLASLGVACDIVGCTGWDRAGDLIREGLTKLGVGVAGLVATDRRTTVKTRVVAQGQQIVRFDIEDDAYVHDSTSAVLSEVLSEAVDRCSVLILQDYDKGLLAPRVIASAMTMARARGIPVVVDPKRRGFFRYDGATVFKPNVRELSEALGARTFVDDADWMEQARRRLGCDTLLVTLGAGGFAMSSIEHEFQREPALARAVYDVSGAGDTVSAVLATAILAGASIGEAAVLANHAAAVEVGKPGVATVTPDEVTEQVAAHAAAPKRSVSLDWDSNVGDGAQPFVN